MNVKTHYGTVYCVESLGQAQKILAETEAEMEHESCPICRGTLSLSECNEQNPVLATDAEIAECLPEAKGGVQ